MSAHGEVHLDPHERRQLGPTRMGIPLLAAGIVVLVVAYVVARLGAEGSRRFWLAYVQNYAFFLSLSLGALFFVLLQHLTRSGWSVVVRRPAEIVSLNLLVLAVLFLPIVGVVLGGSGVIYPWARPASAFQHGHHGHSEAGHATRETHSAATGSARLATAADNDAVYRLTADQPVNASPKHPVNADTRPPHGTSEETTATDIRSPAESHAGGHEAQLILEKRAYLNGPFFTVRWIVYFAVWAGLAWWFWKRSLRQDETHDASLTLSMQTVSAPAMLAFALTLTLASFDLLMSLDPIWFSTIYGVYFFAGCAIGFFALMVVIIGGLQRRGFLKTSITSEHYHDLGKLLFGFVFFWGYIAFSQYMLIWYGNIPEETGWFFRRGVATHAPNVWSWVIVLLLLCHFVVPFVFLLSRDVKRRTALLTFWAIWMLVLHWVDLYWLVMPELTSTHLPLAVEVLCLIGLGCIFVAGLAFWAAGRSLVPVGDPRLGESLAFRNI